MTDRGEGLERLAGTLRERLVREAGEQGGDAAARIAALVAREGALLSEPERRELERLVTERSFGLGPLEPLLADPSVDEVMVNGPGRVWVERHGRIEPTAVAFGSVTELRDAIERILAPLGRRVDEAQPLCDARLSDSTVSLRQWRTGHQEERRNARRIFRGLTSESRWVAMSV